MNANLNPNHQLQRIQVDHDPIHSHDLKIRLERFDEKLGWYTAGSLSFPIHQLPLLQQALDQLNSTDPAPTDPAQRIVPFPMLVPRS